MLQTTRAAAKEKLLKILGSPEAVAAAKQLVLAVLAEEWTYAGAGAGRYAPVNPLYLKQRIFLRPNQLMIQ